MFVLHCGRASLLITFIIACSFAYLFSLFKQEGINDYVNGAIIGQFSSQIDRLKQLHDKVIRRKSAKILKTVSKKWIVVTTIARPTDALRALAQQKDWRVVVVADTKTPEDWTLPNCDFLSVEKQKQLNFAIHRHMPYKSYTRKMVGYLYAIQNGAEWIYDTDDDNQPLGLGLEQFDVELTVSGLSYGKKKGSNNSSGRSLFNPYQFWGQSKVWPRGFPLKNIQEENKEELFRQCRSSRAPLIQQGLVARDPDVDAIYRLLHANSNSGLNVEFSKNAPPIILNQDTFCPFNSQNALFHRDAFWALLLPVTVSFRVTDIWRGYFAQKLLHLTGNRLGFYPVNAVQKRNPHSYLKDFTKERNLYADAGRMVDFLGDWQCESDKNLLVDCMRKLSLAFVRENFWKQEDFDLTNAWIEDLLATNYTFPAIIADESLLDDENDEWDCRSSFLKFEIIDEKKKEEIMTSNLKDFRKFCAAVNSNLSTFYGQRKNFTAKKVYEKLRRVALIITGNYAFGPSISLLQRLYRPHFAIVIFCGPMFYKSIRPSWNASLDLLPFSYINVTAAEINAGYRAYVCPAKAIELRLQNIQGYMVIADDTAYNFWHNFNDEVFLQPSITFGASLGGWPWPHHHTVGWQALNNSRLLLKERLAKQPGNSSVKRSFTYSVKQ